MLPSERQRMPSLPESRARTFDSGETNDFSDVERQVAMLARWMDALFELPLLRWKFGLDAIIGLIPGLGDAATTVVSLYILMLAGRCGVPRITLARMGLNIGIDFVLGSLPIVGDVFDVWWKANQKNSALLRERLAESAVHSRRSKGADWLFVGAILLILAALFVGAVALAWWLVAALWQAVAGTPR